MTCSPQLCFSLAQESRTALPTRHSQNQTECCHDGHQALTQWSTTSCPCPNQSGEPQPWLDWSLWLNVINHHEEHWGARSYSTDSPVTLSLVPSPSIILYFLCCKLLFAFCWAFMCTGKQTPFVPCCCFLIVWVVNVLIICCITNRHRSQRLKPTTVMCVYMCACVCVCIYIMHC